MTPIEFVPDRITYIRTQMAQALIAMIGATAVLWLLGNPHVWTGAVAGLLGITARGWYLASEELAATWCLDSNGLSGPGDRRVALEDIAKVRTLGGSVQIVTQRGDKHLIKYQPDARAAAQRIRTALDACDRAHEGGHATT